MLPTKRIDPIALITSSPLALSVDAHAPDDGVREDASSKRCPVNPRLTDGETNHAELPIHPVSTAPVTIILRRAIIPKMLVGRGEPRMWWLPECFNGTGDGL